jgi:hypothetical protein
MSNERIQLPNQNTNKDFQSINNIILSQLALVYTNISLYQHYF